MRTRGIVLLLSVVSLTLFLLLSKYEDRPVMRNVDFSVTVKVQEKIDTSSRLRLAALAGNVMEGATFFASPEFTVIVTLLLTSFSLFDWKKRRWNPKAIFIPIALTLLVILEIYGKSIVHHPSPPFSMIKNPITMFPANYVNEQFSYPSGHAARAVFMAIVSYYVLRLSEQICITDWIIWVCSVGWDKPHLPRPPLVFGCIGRVAIGYGVGFYSVLMIQ